jgi:hypothetical protein
MHDRVARDTKALREVRNTLEDAAPAYAFGQRWKHRDFRINNRGLTFADKQRRIFAAR